MANDQETVERSWIDSVIEHAVVVFGDKEEALRWLGTPVRALNYATPISRLSSPGGYRLECSR